MKTQTCFPNTQSKIILYAASDGKIIANVLFAEDNFWLTHRTMAELFGVNTSAISKHLRNIYASGELTEVAILSKMETV